MAVPEVVDITTSHVASEENFDEKMLPLNDGAICKCLV